MDKKVNPTSTQPLLFDQPIQMFMYCTCNISPPLADEFTEHMIDD